jgi:hypothetical protein
MFFVMYRPNPLRGGGKRREGVGEGEGEKRGEKVWERKEDRKCGRKREY